MLGYDSYSVTAFVLNPLRCFRCQAHGQVAAVCRREILRCEKCAGGQVTKECVVSVGEKSVHCGGAHVAGDQKCPMQERQVEVARVRVEQKVSYAEAAKRVPSSQA